MRTFTVTVFRYRILGETYHRVDASIRPWNWDGLRDTEIVKQFTVEATDPSDAEARVLLGEGEEI